MVDADSYVSGSSIRFVKLASTLISSLILAWYAGVTDFLYAVLSVPSDFLSAALGWIAETFGLGFEVPEDSLASSWEYAADFFPVAGPLDWVIGVVLVVVFFHATIWMIDRVQEGI